MALLGCLLVQPRRLRLVLRHALSMCLAEAETALRVGVALLGRLPE
jgi:hypothetical protein